MVFRVKDDEIEEEKVDRRIKVEKDSEDENDDQKSDDSNSEEDKKEKKKEEKEAPLVFDNGKTVIARAKLIEKFGLQAKD